MSRIIDLRNQRFGRLLVIKRDESRFESRKVYWICQCDCGNYSSVRSTNLRSGTVRSCGCLRADSNYKRNFKHGDTEHRYQKHLYRVWATINQACYNKNTRNYTYYGARGITVCDEWRNNYMKFREWACANGYDENKNEFVEFILRRINKGKGYTPQNCYFEEKYI